MRYLSVTCLLLTAFLLGCNRPGGPALSISTGAGAEGAEGGGNARTVGWPRKKRLKPRTYQGKSVEDWGKLLDDGDPYTVARAVQALRVLGADGWSHLMKGMESSLPETRRLCLEGTSLPVFKAHGEDGRKILLKLAGDLDDIRIRQRASYYLQHWEGTAPAPGY
jgi:hypothetical protein